MGQPATPRYMPDKTQGFYDELSPGLAFYTFFPIWAEHWELKGDGKSDALKKFISYSKAACQHTEELIKRQSALISTIDTSQHLSITAISTSPFMTGTGMEHPLEIGFAFLNPYGLPYLPGSSVKGVLRNTARLLADNAFGDGSQGWTGPAIEALFGSEPSKGGEESADFRRGALMFWDVIVSPKEENKGGKKSQSMKVDILTPHQSHYQQNGATPHDSGDPTPLPFLCVGAGALFNFHIQANPGLLGEHANTWKDLMQACFQHAFDWLGFGAKTAVGYGILKSTNSLNSPAQPSGGQSGTEQIDLLSWESAEIRQNKGAEKIIATSCDGNDKGKKAEAHIKNISIPDNIKQKLDAKKTVKANVSVRKQGNMFTLIKFD